MDKRAMITEGIPLHEVDPEILKLKTMNAGVYLSAFRSYLRKSARKFADIDPEQVKDIRVITDQLKNSISENARAEYVLYLLWAYSPDHYYFYKAHHIRYIEKSLKMLLIMKTDFIRFNDLNMLRFIEILESRVDLSREKIPYIPGEEIFEEIMQFLYTFITGFKRKNNLPVIAEKDRENIY